jgi:predicted nucleotidyltransferase
MDPGVLRHIINRIVEVAEPERVVLFGSRARGDAVEDSDIDLLVIQETDLPRPHRSLPLYRALRDVPCAKDILVYTSAEVEEYRGLPQSFLMTALREGRVVHDKQSGLHL